jgi:proteasome alpha subunit
MSLPFYVSPEQLMKDRADFARKGIARGRSVVAVQYADGVLFVSENPSQALHKVSEIYDRIAFAAVGRYNEFENLRIAGVRLADMRGYVYGREDVTAKAIANAYAQALGTIFTQEMKPFEVELLVAQLGDDQHADELFHVLYDGSVTDEQGFVAMGGQADALTAALAAEYQVGMSFQESLRLGAKALAASDPNRTFEPDKLEVAVLDRSRRRRTFPPASGWSAASRSRWRSRSRSTSSSRFASRPRSTSSSAYATRSRRSRARSIRSATADRNPAAARFWIASRPSSSSSASSSSRRASLRRS